VDLALNLLCATPEAKLRRRWHFTADGRSSAATSCGGGRPGPHEPPLLAQVLKLDERIVRRLLGDGGVDPVLRGSCGIIEPTGSGVEVPALEDRMEALAALLRQAGVTGEPLLPVPVPGQPDGPSASWPLRSRPGRQAGAHREPE